MALFGHPHPFWYNLALQDVGPTEEVQLSLEQAFYLVYDLDRLRVCLPPGEGRWRGFGEKKEVEGSDIEESRGLGAEAVAEERGDKGAVGDGQEQARPLSAIECWKAYVSFGIVKYIYTCVYK